MAPRTASLTLIERIEQELSGLQTRAAELRCALKIVREFTAERDDSSVPVADIGEVIRPTVDVPEPVKSRIARVKGEPDKTNGGDLEKS
jgi:hypothetical protein